MSECLGARGNTLISDFFSQPGTWICLPCINSPGATKAILFLASMHSLSLCDIC